MKTDAKHEKYVKKQKKLEKISNFLRILKKYCRNIDLKSQKT